MSVTNQDRSLNLDSLLHDLDGIDSNSPKVAPAATIKFIPHPPSSKVPNQVITIVSKTHEYEHIQLSHELKLISPSTRK